MSSGSSAVESLLSSRFVSAEALSEAIQSFLHRPHTSYSEEEVVAFLAGGSEVRRLSGWHTFDSLDTSMLEDGAQYLVKRHSEDQRFVELLTWNAVYQYWDDADGDYFECDSVVCYKSVDF